MNKIIRLKLIIVLLCCSLISYSQQKKVIIDCDPGVDDAMALVLALHSPTIQIVGITITTSDINISQRTKNALRIVELSGKNIPVFQGALNPLVVDPIPAGKDVIHGDDQLGNNNQPEPKIFVQKKTAAQFIVDIAKENPGQITILAQARLTNLADAIRLDSNVVKNIKDVVVVAGTFKSPGLISPVAEPNIWFDPHAADMVFTASWKVTMLPLDVTMKLSINDSLLQRIKNINPKYGSFIYSITRLTRDFHVNVFHADGIICIDAAGILCLIDPSLFKFNKAPVRVVTEGLARGQTIMPAYEFQFGQQAWVDKPSASIAFEVDIQRFLKDYEQIMKGKQQ
jgi:inosine-uridine nucleoside N-ribohydrolase